MEPTSLVRADVANCPECLDGVQLAHDDMARGHALHADRERDGQHHDQRRRDHAKSCTQPILPVQRPRIHRAQGERRTSRDRIYNDLAVVHEPVRRSDDERKHHRNHEQPDRELAQPALEGRAHVHPKEPPDVVRDGERVRGHVVVEQFLALLVPPHLAHLRAPAALQARRDRPNLGVHPRRDYDALRAPLGDGAGRVRHVQAVADGDRGPGRVVLEGVLGDGDGLAGEEGLVDFEVHGVEEAEVGGDDVACVEDDDVPGDELGGGDYCSAGVAHDGG